MSKLYVGRVVSVLTAVTALVIAALPVVLDFDWRSTAGAVAGVVAVLAVFQKWLSGLQAHEAREAIYAVAPPTVTWTSPVTSAAAASKPEPALPSDEEEDADPAPPPETATPAFPSEADD